jgi:hypothetical protein
MNVRGVRYTLKSYCCWLRWTDEYLVLRFPEVRETHIHLGNVPPNRKSFKDL